MNKQELLKGLSEEQLNKIKSCKDTQEMLEVAKQEGIELTEEQLEAVSGGGCWSSITRTCPECGEWIDYDCYGNSFHCKECGCWWDEEGILEHGKKYKGE